MIQFYTSKSSLWNRVFTGLYYKGITDFEKQQF